MVAEVIRVDIDEAPPIAQLIEEARSAGSPVVLTRDGEELAVITPAKVTTGRRPRARPVTEDDPLFRMIGMITADVPTDMAERKHEYLVQAFEHE